MKNLKMILIVILFGIVALMLLKISMDASQQNLNVSFNVSSSVKIDLCENLTGIEKAECYVKENLNNLNLSLEICRSLKKEFANDDAVCIAKISSIVSKENPEMGLAVCDKIKEVGSDADGSVSMKCYENIVPLFSADTSKVEEICGKSFYPFVCYTVAARAVFNKNLTKSLYFCSIGGDMCFKELARISKNSTQAISFCKNVTANSSDQVNCFSVVVYNTMLRNETEAEKIAAELDCCWNEIALVLSMRKDRKAIDVCTKHNPRECFWYILPNLGVIDKNFALSYCDNISNDVNRDICYFTIVKSIADVDLDYALNICAKTKFRDDCYRVAATSIKNKSNAIKVCESINVQYYRDLCYNKI